jgi:hypothetical protein
MPESAQTIRIDPDQPLAVVGSGITELAPTFKTWRFLALCETSRSVVTEAQRPRFAADLVHVHAASHLRDSTGIQRGSAR